MREAAERIISFLADRARARSLAEIVDGTGLTLNQVTHQLRLFCGKGVVSHPLWGHYTLPEQAAAAVDAASVGQVPQSPTERVCLECSQPFEPSTSRLRLRHPECQQRHLRRVVQAKTRARRTARLRARGLADVSGERRYGARTLKAKPLSKGEIAAQAELPTTPEDHHLPLLREECAGGPRPCPLVRCKYHLYLDVNPDTGTIHLNFPALEVWEMKETCALDVADRGGITLEEVGEILNLTRERIRQIEVRARGTLRADAEMFGLDRPDEGPEGFEVDLPTDGDFEL